MNKFIINEMLFWSCMTRPASLQGPAKPERITQLESGMLICALIIGDDEVDDHDYYLKYDYDSDDYKYCFDWI